MDVPQARTRRKVPLPELTNLNTKDNFGAEFYF
ncbi:hypothetical protein AWB74_08753 [Caballeronia arvi]|uniref:Uncharacterized protein n=1 Tax=Caballeronia arvi TaxID=1777135 RepID=A0A158L650_9BURK|nr:hypothetical protein AWB74_08753 [Caballeronia arvi]